MSRTSHCAVMPGSLRLGAAYSCIEAVTVDVASKLRALATTPIFVSLRPVFSELNPSYLTGTASPLYSKPNNHGSRSVAAQSS
jgi:hypothetical protein